MAEPDVEVKDSAPKEKKPAAKSAIVKILIGFALVVALFAMVFFTAYYVTQKMNAGQGPEPPGISGGHTPSYKEAPETIEMGQFTAIITDASGRSYNLRTTILLSMNKERPAKERDELKKEVEERMPQLKDGINEVLWGLDPQGFVGSQTQRSEGLAELKASIIRAVNARMKNQIDGVFIPEFIFQ